MSKGKDEGIGQVCTSKPTWFDSRSANPQGKIRKLMDYTQKGGDVADPWYTRRFDVTYSDVVAGCEGLLKEILK